MDEKRVVDYFVCVGPPDSLSLSDEICTDSISTKTSNSQIPITDITVIIRSQGEVVPSGYECIEETQFGFPANLNHGSLRSPDIYLCFKRGKDKAPLVDIGVLYEGKERIMSDSEVVHTTPTGKPANVNNSGSKTFLTYRRALETAPCNQLVVTDIGVIFTNKGETPPHAFCLIPKNLNKGMVGSDIYICYKKSMNKLDSFCFKPAILGRFPLKDYTNIALPESVALFCLPMGATVECWPKKAQKPQPVFSTFVLTSNSAEKVYGAAVTFFEKYPEHRLSEERKTFLNFATPEDRHKKVIHANKAICLLSRWPFFSTFERFLFFLYKMILSGSHPLPIERYISHFMLEVPFPSPQRPRILIQLSDETISLSQPEDTPLPLSGASFIQLLRNLGADKCIHVLLFALLEQKILLHSLRPDVLTSVAEALSSIIFPFHWQCPYIPLCPLELSDVLNAPLPFIIGVDSRYFDLYDPPSDVICVDLDTKTTKVPDDKKGISLKLLPKRPARVLRHTLHCLFEKIMRMNAIKPSTLPKNFTPTIAPFELDFRIKKVETQLELEIQEAFLRFMSSILKGYRSYLKPITCAPTAETTDPNSLFDLQGFLKSRDRTHHKFFSNIMRTQMFIRFIEERSFVSDKDVSLAFFDECAEKVDLMGELGEYRLLEADESQQNDRTVFIAPPEPTGLPAKAEYTYHSFGPLKPHLYHKHPANNLQVPTDQNSPSANSPLAKRTKQEVKVAQRIAKKHAESPLLWAKCLLSYCYSLWFIHLPAYAKSNSSKDKALSTAYDIVKRMQSVKLQPPDEVCYRVLMLLCGIYSQPILAVKLWFEMKKSGVQPNAITYGYYNKAVLESHWPEPSISAALLWKKLRNVIIGVAHFRQGAKRRARRSLSLYSDMEFDRLSGGSTGSSNPEDMVSSKAAQPEPATDAKVDDQSSSGGQSDGGYCSLNQDENQKPSPLPSRPTSEICDNAESNSAPKKPSAVRSINFDEIDFTASNAFRSRIGSIVSNSASSLGSNSCLYNVEHSAGVLMSGHNNLIDGSGVLDNSLTAIRRRHKSESENLHNSPCKIKSYSPTLSSNFCNEQIPRPFLRSNSFGCDAQILKKNHAGDIINPDSLSSVRSMPIPVAMQSKENNSAFGLTRCDEETEIDLVDEFVDESTPTLSLSGRPKSPNIPIQTTNSGTYLSNSGNSESVAGSESSTGSSAVSSSAPSEKDFLSLTLSPLKEAWLNLDLFVGQGFPRMASSLSSSFGWNSTTESADRKTGNPKVTRSSTFHGPSDRRASSAEPSSHAGRNNSIPGANYAKKFLPRSSTLPVSPEGKLLQKAESFEGVEDSSLGTNSPFRFPRFSSKHSEVFMDHIKSAASSMASKFSGFKQSLSNTNTPTKTGNTPSLPKPHEMEPLLLYDDDDATVNLTEPRKISSECLGSVSEETELKDGSNSGLGFITGGASVSASSIYDILQSHYETNTNKSSSKIAMEIILTSCSRCHLCLACMFDEEIMEGWAADDSNLNTQCAFCKGKFVPLLTIFIKDLRIEDAHLTLLTPSHSVESLQSASNSHHLQFEIEDDFPSDDASKRNLESLNTSVREANLISIDQPSNSLVSNVIMNDCEKSDVVNKTSSSSSNYLSRQQSSQNDKFSAFLKENSSASEETVSVPYLSPLVLRKELETVLEHEGDSCLTKGQFVDEHPILFWNLIWFFKRINITSHLSELCLQAESIKKGKKFSEEWSSVDAQNVSIKCFWDNAKFHEELGPPMYILWNRSDYESELIDALVIENKRIPKNVMKQILSDVQCNDLLSPIKLLISERQKRKMGRTHHSMYRDILFLCIIALGKSNINRNEFDREFRRAYSNLSPKEKSLLSKVDHPPSNGTIFCHRFFKELDLSTS